MYKKKKNYEYIIFDCYILILFAEVFIDINIFYKFIIIVF